MKVTSPILQSLRDLYAQAVEVEEKNKELTVLIESLPASNVMVLAYKGSNTALRAKYAINPYVKWNLLKESFTYFDATVKKDAENIEIRFLRFAVESIIPAFLNMSKHIGEDKELIFRKINTFYQAEQQLTEDYIEFLLKSSHLTPSEKERLKKIRA